MKKKLTILFTTLVALVLEILPYGAVLNFANPEGESWRRTFSYFDLTPFGYANFSPFIVALLTCSLLVLTIVSMLTQKTLRKPIISVSVIAAVLSFAPLLMGIKYYSVVGALISATLAIIAVISFIKSKNQ